MLIDFRGLWPKYNIKPKGVLHIGANVGEEAPVYLELGVKKQIWIEGDSGTFQKLQNNLVSNPEAHPYCFVVSDSAEKVKFNISSNASQSSSILEFGTHATVHPDVTFVRSEERYPLTIESFYWSLIRDEEWFEQGDYDFLNIDLQGAEMKALKGMGDFLHLFKWAYLEVNKAHLYVGCPLVEELDEYLLKFGFVRVETQWAGNTNWGDALWVKKELL
jgi:FkbM family methyltransferase